MNPNQLKTEYITLHCDAHCLNVTYSSRVFHHGEFVTQLFSTLRDRVRVGDMHLVLELVAELSLILKSRRGIDLVSTVIMKVDGKLDVSLNFVVEVA